MKQDLETMSKIELLDYSKRARYMLGKNYAESIKMKEEIEALKLEVFMLKKKLAQEQRGLSKESSNSTKPQE